MFRDNFDSEETVEILRRLVAEHGSQRAAAKALGNENFQSGVSNTLKGVRPPSPALREALERYCAAHPLASETAGYWASPTSDSSVRRSARMKFAKDSKNTYKFESEKIGPAAYILYVPKNELSNSPFSDAPPDEIEVIVTAWGRQAYTID